MNNDKCKTMKDQCGTCGKSAGSGVILCSGPCNKWNHFKCVNLTYIAVKKMSPEVQKLWQCPNCSNSEFKDDPVKENSEVDFLFDPDEPNETSFLQLFEINSQLKYAKEKAETSLRVAEEVSEEMSQKWEQEIKTLKNEILMLKGDLLERNKEIIKLRELARPIQSEDDDFYTSPRVLISTGTQTSKKFYDIEVDQQEYENLKSKLV
uniref:PHD-type domain-containing protein n=1 Tax=Cuerna arida TaxID=1464854 RepID=A0A1B6G799_9HEMI